MQQQKWNRRYAERDLLWPEAPNQILIDELRDLPPARALDLAAGEGRNALWLAERDWRVTAVDFSHVALDRGRGFAEQRSLGSITWVFEDLTVYQGEEGSYDLVLLTYLHLPWAEFRGVLHRAVRTLKPGGLLLVLGHDVSNIEHGVGGPQNPELLYDPQRLRAELGELDIEIEKAEKLRRPVDHEEVGEGDAVQPIDCLVRARRL
ncbi:MAG TPA: class I SAM-dependent methyltransferase [Sediminispirochaeta sp.]|nr:class I SAM-dependent methyltransferase [Sediminispirochaeta sp.]